MSNKTVTIIVKKAVLTHDTETFGKMVKRTNIKALFS